MSKPKKIILMIIAVIFGLLTLCNSLFLYLVGSNLSDMHEHFYAHFPFLTPQDQYVRIDDVAYISYGDVYLDAEKIANGEIQIKTGEEIYREYYMENEAYREFKENEERENQSSVPDAGTS